MNLLHNLFGKKQGNSALAQEHFEKGAEYAKKEKWQQAIASLKEAVRLNPKHAKAHMALCMSYGGAMDLDSARRHYEILKKLDSNLADRLANSPAGMLMLGGGNIIQM